MKSFSAGDKRGGPASKIIASFANRVHNPAVLARHANNYPAVKLVKVEDVFGGWEKANKDHFAEGGVLSKVFADR